MIIIIYNCFHVKTKWLNKLFKLNLKFIMIYKIKIPINSIKLKWKILLVLGKVMLFLMLLNLINKVLILLFVLLLFLNNGNNI